MSATAGHRRELVTDDGVTLVWDEIGPPDGTPVVLCHGLGASGLQFAADADHFATLGCRVLVPDLRGHGRSGVPAVLAPGAFLLPRLAADLRHLLDAAGVGPVHWVGNSLGGIVALHMLEGGDRPRFRTLATFGTSYSLRLPAFAGAAVPLLYRLFGARLIARMTALSTSADPAARRIIEQMLRAFDPAVGRLVAEAVSRYDLIEPAAAATDLPILLLRARADRGVNAALGPTLRRLSGLPHFRRRDIGGGHCANLDATAEVRSALEAHWSA